MIYYRFNLQNITEPYWYGTRVCKKRYLKSPQWLRNQKVKLYPFWRIDKIKWNIVNNGGWHFSFVMSNSMIAKKIKSYAHKEFNIKKFNSLRLINKKIQKKKDIFDRKFNFQKIKNINELPQFLIKNPKKFKHLMI